MTNTELIKIREEKKLTKSEFAKLLGITAMLEGRYEGGKLIIPEAVAAKAAELAAEEKAVPARKAGKAKTKRAAETLEEVMPAPVEEKKVKKSATKKTAAPKSAPKKAASKKASSPQILIESLLGGTITPEEVLKRVPKGVDKVYIKPEENTAYWVKGKKTGSVELW